MTSPSLLAPARLASLPVLRTQSDERLVDLAREGSEAAFEAIVVRYRAPLLRYCAGVLPGGGAVAARPCPDEVTAPFQAFAAVGVPGGQQGWLE